MRRSAIAALALLSALPLAPPPAGAADPYRIGLSAAITGRASGTYAPTYEAYRVYFKRVNDAGGISGHPVEIVYEDDRGEPQRAAAAAKKLAETSVLVVVSSVSATYKPFMTEAEVRKVPVLFGGGVCPAESFPPANKLVFCSTSFGAKWDSRFALDFIKRETGGKRIKLGLVGQDIPLSRIEMEFAEGRAKEMGFDVIPLVIAPITATDYTPFAQKLKEAGAEWVFTWGIWSGEIGVFEALQRLGWNGSYLLYAHQQAQDDLTRLKTPNLLPFGGNSYFVENLPIHAEITTLVKGQTQHPAHYMSEGWVSAMVLEAALKACGWPCSADKLAGAMGTVKVDTKGLRGGALEWTADNHYRKTSYYKVHRWDPGKNTVVVHSDWTRMDIK